MLVATLSRERRLAHGLWAICGDLDLGSLGCSATSTIGIPAGTASQ
jgi:hypothetical protein